MKFLIVFFILCFSYSKSYSQKINFPLEKYNTDSITYLLSNKILSEIHDKWEKNSKDEHTIESFKEASTVGDSTTSISAIIPNYKFTILINQLNKKDAKYSILFNKPLNFYVLPTPFINKIYSYDVEDAYFHKSESVSLLGSSSANFIASSLNIDTTYKPLFYGYFLEKDRYWNNFLVEKNNENELLIIDRQLKQFHSIDEFINYRYNSIENLLVFIKTKEETKGNIVLYIIDGLKTTENISPMLSPNVIEKMDFLNPTDVEVQSYKDRWMYDMIVKLKLKNSVKLLNLNEFYQAFKINKINKKLKICENGKLISNPQALLIDSAFISKIEIIKGKYFIETSLGKTLYDTKTKTYFSTTKTIINSKEKFINIITKVPQTNEVNK